MCDPSSTHMVDQAVQLAFAAAVRKAKPRGVRAALSSSSSSSSSSFFGQQEDAGPNATRAPGHDALSPGERMGVKHWPHEDDAFGTIMQWLYARIMTTRGGRLSRPSEGSLGQQ